MEKIVPLKTQKILRKWKNLFKKSILNDIYSLFFGKVSIILWNFFYFCKNFFSFFKKSSPFWRFFFIFKELSFISFSSFLENFYSTDKFSKNTSGRKNLQRVDEPRIIIKFLIQRTENLIALENELSGFFNTERHNYFFLCCSGFITEW